MKILIAQNRGLAGGVGGTEKVCISLANYLAEKGHQVIVVSNEKNQAAPFFKIDPKVKLVNLYTPENAGIEKQQIEKYRGKNLLRKLKYKTHKVLVKLYNLYNSKGKSVEEIFYHNLQIKSRVWKKFIDGTVPDVVVTMSISTLLEISYQQKYDMPIIDSVNGRPDYDYSDILWYRADYEMRELRNSYKALTAIQVLFDSYKNFLPPEFKGKAEVIPNVVPQMPARKFEAKQGGEIVNISSLVTNCKHQDLAINAFAKIAQKYSGWKLNFYGKGDDFAYLQQLIEKLGMAQQISLCGVTDEPLEKLQQADIFVFPSRYEGFPLALTEAMSTGLACIGLESCSGTNEIIRDGENGFLTKDSLESFSGALEKLMQSRELRQKLGTQAQEDMKAYQADAIWAKWEDLIKECVLTTPKH